MNAAIDRFCLRLWWRAEGIALRRMQHRWPLEELEARRTGQSNTSFLTDAYLHLVADRKFLAGTAKPETEEGS